MGQHVRDRVLDGDRELNGLLKQTWPMLPAPLRKTAQNVATIRVGMLCFTLLLPMAIIAAAVNDTPEQFAAYVMSFTPILSLLAICVGLTIMNIRAQMVAPAFIDAYAQMLPTHEERIRSAYAVRGPGDVLAPWIRTRPGVLAAIGRRFNRWMGV